MSADGKHWFLLNASPDLRTQINATPELRPAADSKRHSPIEAVLLTNADLDHTLGLLSLREGEPLAVHAPTNVQHSLTNPFGVAAVLNSFCGLKWVAPPSELTPLDNRDGSRSGLLYQAYPLTGLAPRFSRSTVAAQGNVVGYRVIDERSGARLLFVPEVAALDESLLRVLPECEALLFDGTFWSEDEMLRSGVGMLSASDMGHVPISGENGSLKVLAELPVKNKIYIHINNTNPILIEDSPERSTVNAAGCIVASDGMELII